MRTPVPQTSVWRGESRAAPSIALRPTLRASAAPPVVRTTLPAPQASHTYRTSQPRVYRAGQPHADREVLYSRLPQITPAGLGSVQPSTHRTVETLRTTREGSVVRYARNRENLPLPTYRPPVIRGQYSGGVDSGATSSATSVGSGSTRPAPEPRTYQRRQEAVPSTRLTTTHRTHTTQPTSGAHTSGGITWVRFPADAGTGREVAKPLRIIRAPPPNVVRLPRPEEHLSRHTPQRGRLVWFPEDYTPTQGKDVAASRETAVTECSFA